MLGEVWAQMARRNLGGGPPESLGVRDRSRSTPAAQGSSEEERRVTEKEAAKHRVEGLGNGVGSSSRGDRRRRDVCLLSGEAALLHGERRDVAGREHVFEALDAAARVDRDEGVLRLRYAGKGHAP